MIVARDTARMDALAADLHARYGVEVECLTADLAIRADVDRVAGRIEDPARPIDTVINNAGFALHAKLLDAETLELQERAMDVMCWAVLQLSAAAGRAMKARGHGAIINVSSTSAWINSGNYSAIKAWVLSFTEALALELAGTGVTATALCPGWVKTEFHTRAGISNKNLPGFVWVDPDQLVRECLVDAAKGKPVSIPTVRWKVAIFVAQHGPQSLMFTISKRLMASRHRQKGSAKANRKRESVS